MKEFEFATKASDSQEGRENLIFLHGPRAYWGICADRIWWVITHHSDPFLFSIEMLYFKIQSPSG